MANNPAQRFARAGYQQVTPAQLQAIQANWREDDVITAANAINISNAGITQEDAVQIDWRALSEVVNGMNGAMAAKIGIVCQIGVFNMQLANTLFLAAFDNNNALIGVHKVKFGAENGVTELDLTPNRFLRLLCHAERIPRAQWIRLKTDTISSVFNITVDIATQFLVQTGGGFQRPPGYNPPTGNGPEGTPAELRERLVRLEAGLAALPVAQGLHIVPVDDDAARDAAEAANRVIQRENEQVEDERRAMEAEVEAIQTRLNALNPDGLMDGVTAEEWEGITAADRRAQYECINYEGLVAAKLAAPGLPADQQNAQVTRARTFFTTHGLEVFGQFTPKLRAIHTLPGAYWQRSMSVACAMLYDMRAAHKELAGTALGRRRERITFTEKLLSGFDKCGVTINNDMLSTCLRLLFTRAGPKLGGTNGVSREIINLLRDHGSVPDAIKGDLENIFHTY